MIAATATVSSWLVVTTEKPAKGTLPLKKQQALKQNKYASRFSLSMLMTPNEVQLKKKITVIERSSTKPTPAPRTSLQQPQQRTKYWNPNDTTTFTKTIALIAPNQGAIPKNTRISPHSSPRSQEPNTRENKMIKKSNERSMMPRRTRQAKEEDVDVSTDARYTSATNAPSPATLCRLARKLQAKYARHTERMMDKARKRTGNGETEQHKVVVNMKNSQQQQLHRISEQQQLLRD
ncbi:hypothetical protein CVS40_11015 [Lucilia cuprina]|nr:hypothetical protein CVS40_11015 [Lucilia cuprina]